MHTLFCNEDWSYSLYLNACHSEGSQSWKRKQSPSWTWCIKKTNKFRSRNPHLAVSMRVRNITAPYTNGEHWMLLTNISLDTVHAQLRDVVSWIWKLPRCNLIDPNMPQLYIRCMHNGKRMKSTFKWRQITVSLLCSPILRSMSGPGLYPSLKKILGYFPIYTI